MRREFKASVKVEAFKRAKGFCERPGCGAKLTPGKYTYDHIVPDQMGGEPTLENCQCICSHCDKEKTRKDQHDIAKAKRRERRALGIRKQSRFPCSRDSRWKKRMDGSVVER